MQAKYIPRNIEQELKECLLDFPAVAVLGPRQCGKSTLARKILSSQSNALYLDLEKPADLAKFQEPELFLSQHTDKLICLDEVQRLPEIFAPLRAIIDSRNKNGQFLFLGSASSPLSELGEIIRQIQPIPPQPHLPSHIDHRRPGR